MLFLESQINAHSAYCTNQITRLHKSLEAFPAGTLRCYKNGIYTKNVLLLDGRQTNISKENNDLAKRLARKAVFEACLTDCRADLEICNLCLGKFEKHPHALEKTLANEALCSLLSQTNPDIDIQAWMDEPYQSNPYHPEQLIYKTASGTRVRSKSEVIVAAALENLGIPYRYEQQLTIGGKVIYPDFTILHPYTRIIYIIELFGMMDDKIYAAKCLDKLRLYIENGYIPQDKLITFYETFSRPIKIGFVESTIRQLIF